MNKLTVTTIASIALVALVLFAPDRGTAGDRLSFRVTLTQNDVRVTDNGAVSVSDNATGHYTLLMDDGAPSLPYRIVSVLLPSGQVVDGFDATVVSTLTLAKSFEPASARNPMPTDGAKEAVVPSSAVAPTAKDGTFPGELARYLGTGMWHGRTIASFAVFPIRMTADDLVLHEDVALRVRTRNGGMDGTVTPVRMNPTRATAIENTIRATVINPGAASTYDALPRSVAPVAGGFQPTTIPSLEGSLVDEVIITTDALAPSYQRLADWRTAQGIPTVVRTITWIRSNYRGGSDMPETVRTFVQDAYAKWGIRYVLLGGDTPQISPRFLYSKHFYGGYLLPVDFYFGAVDGDFNADHDNTFGELLTDSPDLYVEVDVGRLPTATPAQVDAMINKIISYETPVHAGYTNKLLALAEVLFPTPWNFGDPIQQNGGTNAEFALARTAGSNLVKTRSYETDYLFPGSVPESRLAAIDSINSGYNFVLHIGHGYRFNAHCADANISIPDADGLNNTDRYCNIYMLNCTAAAFDFDCLGEHFLNNDRGGAVSVIGTNNSAFPDASNFYMDEYMRLVFEEDVVRVGEAFSDSRLTRTALALLNDGVDLWTHYIYTLLADPALSMWTGPAKAITVSHPDTLVTGELNVTVNVLSGGLPVASADVCLWKGDEDYQVKTTDGAGNATFDFTSEEPGSISVVVTGLNCRRHQSWILTVPGAGALLAFSSATVDDDFIGGTWGNADGIIDSGELILLTPSMQNIGVAASVGATLTLRCSNPNVILIDSTATIAPIAQNTTMAAADTWKVGIVSAMTDETAVKFTVHIVEGGNIRDDTFECIVRAPKLELAGLYKDDSAPYGNGDGIITNGEQFRLYCEIKNYGTGASFGVSGAIKSIDGGAVVAGSLSTYPDLGHLVNGENNTAFILSETLASSENLIEITITDYYNRVLRDTLELREPQAPSNLIFDASQGSDRINVAWTASPSPDVNRYHVYHSLTPGGPYTRANSDAVFHATFTDEGLLPSTRYYFVVSALDASGNESPISVESTASTNPSQLQGWPNVLADASANSPALGDIDADGKQEVIVGNNFLYAWRPNGQEVRDGDSQALTWGVFSDVGVDFIGPAALAELDGQYGLDIVAAAYTSKEIFCFSNDGTILPGWPRATIDRVRASVVVGDMDGDEILEIVAVDQEGYLYAWHADGSEVIDGDANPGTDGVFKRLPDTPWWQVQSPALADIDSDGKDELIIPTQDAKLYVFNEDGSDVTGWPRTLSSFAGGGVAIGDIDNNGDLEIVVGTRDTGETFALNHDNTILWMRWITTNTFFNPSPALADLDGDGKLETILPSSNKRIYVIDYNGNDFPGWPVYYSQTTYTESSPIVADITGDGSLDIILGDEGRYINAWDTAGNLLPGFPLVVKDAVRGTPAVGDIDADGDIDLVAAGYDRTVYIWDLAAPYQPSKVPWGMYKGNVHRNSQHDFLVASGVGDNPVAAPSVSRLEQNYPNPFNPSTRIVFHVAGTGMQKVSLNIYDVTGARVTTLVSETMATGRHEHAWDGTNAGGQRVGSGVYFYRLVVGGHGVETRKMVLLK